MLIHVLTFGNPARLTSVTQTDLDLLSEAAQNLGHKIEVIYSRDCQLEFTGKPRMLIKSKKRKNIDIVLVKANFLGADLDLHAGFIKQFELAGIPVINNSAAVIRAKNKMRTLQVLNQHKVPIPKSYIIRSSEYIDDVVEKIGSYPVILKSLSGSHGAGVAIIESQRGLRSIIEMMIESESSAPLTVQEYIKESRGKDIRVFIIGKRIIGAMERIATKRGEFRSNFHLGGRVRVAEMSRREKDVAFVAVEACKLEIAGVDILRTKKGPKVLEVNANPGLEGITKATGRDVAGEIIKYTVAKARREMRKKEKK